jgi:hypothetical protein
MGELQQVRLPLARSQPLVDLGVLERQRVQRAATCWHAVPSDYTFECHVVFDVDGEVSTTVGADEKVWLPHAAAGLIGRQTTSDDHERSLVNRLPGRGLQRLGVVARGDAGIWMVPDDFGEHGCFELAAAVEATLELRRGGDRLGRDEDIVLRTNRALLRHVPALERNRRGVETPHDNASWMCGDGVARLDAAPGLASSAR